MDVQKFASIADEWVKQVQQVTDWDAQSPCDDWTAAQVLDHAIGWFPQIVGPAAKETEPIARAEEFRKILLDTLGDKEKLASTVHSPVATFDGRTVEDIILNNLTFDSVAHIWDITRSQGLADPTFEEGLLKEGVEKFATGGEDRAKSGKFDAPVEVSDDAPLLDQLVAALGRDPHWGEK